MRHTTLVTFLLTATPVFAGPYDGLYYPDGIGGAQGWDCVSVGSDGGAFAIQDDILHGVESQCRLTNPVAVNGMDATLYDAECMSEGEESSRRLMVLRLRDGVALIGDGYVFPLKSCP
ncbi:hypothetical protein MCELHM10_02285 [Paracoccaceae bacterium]|jgi:hypothetical protein